MNILLLILLVAAFPPSPSVVQEQYVCLPCGYACDHTIHHGPGTCSSCNMALVKKSSVRFKDISAEEFCERITQNKEVVILDVRSPAEFNGSRLDSETYGHFKGSININVTELESRLAELSKYKNKEVLVYCSHSHRSPRASYLLSTKGFTNVKNLTGGVSTLAKQKDARWLQQVFVFH
jgi:rhodanese-related sulfurtransferase